ncbi:hypothetical protein HF1_02960 [Mycoplasma haemofelis str. Langford 1]|uniref:Uncharacterized protein n=1 Tax=Mycoplasma haemofelis (strain Langford 1) TaxID=941640 RepID=E8ZGN3_MYCHL|nr:hypothetical protein [Mycoplasma haemofelis]CBY92304.1 hypothetical protein HF1_02960 [Mycoplasma haemofelis str. Langford 1]
MVAEGTLKMVLLGAVGSVGAGIGGFRNYLGSSWRAVSKTGRTNWKLRSCSIYEAEGFNLVLTKEGAHVRSIKYSGDAEEFLSGINRRVDKKFKKDVTDRCVSLFDRKIKDKNIYVWQGKSDKFELGNEKWYYTPILQKDWLEEARKNPENKGLI